MKAHVENNSKQGDQDIPPFYFPAPHVSGPDVIFFVKINGNMYPCFVQLKLRQLRDYCPTGTYISMVITYPAEVVKFQVVRPDPEPELEGLQRVSIGIDDNNFSKIFPRRHVEFLDKLKGHKRRSEDQQSQKSKKKANDPSQYDEQ
ncbi:hypothetical protein BGX33_000396 [Mortierella sp. NVP41]|nr:hypothetical protein BGX33_000396 [Mortierella sp. NVP41]